MSIAPPRGPLRQAVAIIPPRPLALDTDARCEPHQKAAPYECYRCGRFCCGFCFDSLARDSICAGCETLLQRVAEPTPRQVWLSKLAMGSGAWWTFGLASVMTLVNLLTRGQLDPRFRRTLVAGAFGLGPGLWVIALAALALWDAPPQIRRALRPRFVLGAGMAAMFFVLGLIMVFN